MDSLIHAVRRLGAPLVGVLFLLVWCVNAVPTYPGFGAAVPGVLSALLMAFLIGISGLHPLRSLLGVGLVLLSHFVWPFLLTTASDTYTYVAFGLVLFFVGVSSSTPTRTWGFLGAVGITIAAWGLFISRELAARAGFNAADIGGEFSHWFMYLVQFTVVTLGLWFAGFLLRVLADRKALLAERAKAQEDLRAAEIDLSLEQERGRISQELHDVLAHSLAVIAMQADGARYASHELPAQVSDALTEIARAARHALIEAQLVIEGASDDDRDRPQPGIVDVAGLVETMRAGGLDVSLTDDDEHHPLSVTQELAVFRIIQESLTNTVKHAPGAPATVVMDWNGPGLSLQIMTASATTPEGAPAAPVGGGRGITGMQQRARTAGGWLSAEADDSGYRVTAFIPYRDDQNLEPQHQATESVSRG